MLGHLEMQLGSPGTVRGQMGCGLIAGQSPASSGPPTGVEDSDMCERLAVPLAEDTGDPGGSQVPGSCSWHREDTRGDTGGR